MAQEDDHAKAAELGQTLTPAPQMVMTPPPGPASDSLIGQTVTGRYRVLRKLGEGGMGTVYLAEHIAIEKKIALKVLLHEYARKADLKERFLQEAKAAAKIGHENIVDIIDFGPTPDNSVFFAMEYLEGDELGAVLRRDGPMSWERAKPILVQICRAMGAAHSKQIIHRDMKPENIYLIDREGRKDFVKVLDFGIAKVSGMNDGERRLTRTGMIFGTPEYMSPEQAQGHRPDHRVDIYALGVIMYEMLTGEVPFKADTFMGILTKHIFEAPQPPSQIRPMSADIEHIVLKAMAKDRDDRYRSMTEMAMALNRCAGRVTRPTGDREPVVRTLTPAPERAAFENLPAAEHPMFDSAVPLTGAPQIPQNRTKLFVVMTLMLLLAGGGLLFALFGNRGPSPQKDPPTKPLPVKTPLAGAADGGSQLAQRADLGTPKRPLKPPTKTVTPTKLPVSASAARVTISLHSVPSGAQILIGRHDSGKVTPSSIELRRSSRKTTIKLKKHGFRDEVLRVVPSHDRSYNARLDRRPTIIKPPTKQPPKQPPSKTFGRPDELIDPFKER
ncbi:MAG: serine/threonine protein kinase [Deltaproteobacteria bacterium]|nr:serine/threonine protein kinase [Deltaproteobacteria bacterium]